MKYNRLVLLLLFMIIPLNLYVLIHNQPREGFVKDLVKGVLELIPIEPIKLFLQTEVTKGEDEEIVLSIAIGIFKLILLVGVMPFLLVFAVKFIVIGGMQAVGSSMISGMKKMTQEEKIDVTAIALKNHNDMKFIQKEIQSLKKQADK